jgi:DNA-binding NarL/FixJ family response regulator
MPALALKTSDLLSGPVSNPVRRELGLSATASWRELASGMAPSTRESGQLSPAEQVVLAQLRQGLSNREIAAALGKSERTVKNQVSACLAKYGVPTRARLIALLR